MDKQRAVEHDQLVHEFETLTSDLDGLLGLLENTLDSDDANFEAKRLLCTLFQASAELKYLNVYLCSILIVSLILYPAGSIRQIKENCHRYNIFQA